MSHHNSEGRSRKKKKRGSISPRTFKTTAYTGGEDGFTAKTPSHPDDFTRPATRPTPDLNKGAADRAGKKRKQAYSRKEFGE